MSDLIGRKLGEFVVIEELGRGGHGIVWRCTQQNLLREVAIKVMQRRDPEREERFLREAQLASKLEHINAAHIYAFGIDEEVGLWIAMELVRGTTFAERLETHGCVPVEQFLPFWLDLADVVQAAHERGIVHGDLKPLNIMVIERGGRLIPKLLDLGIAREGIHAKTVAEGDGGASSPGEPTGDELSGDTKEAAPEALVAQILAGSYYYMAPELWRNGGQAGPAADIYALGVVAFEALTGRVPFFARDPEELRTLHQWSPVPPLGPDFSPEVDKVILRALAKEPHLRYPTAHEFGADLAAALRAQPEGQVRSLARVWKDGRRSPSLLLKDGGDGGLMQLKGANELEREFLTASRDAARSFARRRALLRYLVAGSVVAFALAGVWQWGKLRTEKAEEVGRLRTEKAEELGRLRTKQAQEIADLTIALSERERGRAALLYGEPGAARHLANAYQRDHSGITAFMLARALQPQLAEQARFASTFGRMWSATFSPDRKQVVTSDDKNAQLWDAKSYRVLFTLPHDDTVYQAVYSADGTKLLTAGGNGAVRIWDASSGRLMRELRREGRRPRYHAVAYSPNEKLIAAIDLDGAAAYVWNAMTGVLLAELRNDGSGFPSLSFSFDGRWLATCGGGDVRVFDTRTWEQALTVPGAHRMSWRPRDQQLVTGGLQGDVSIWVIRNGARVHRMREFGEQVDALAFSPDGRLVITASRDGAEQVWDATSGKLRSQVNYLHGAIRSVEFDMHSALVVAGGANGSVVVSDALRGVLVSAFDGPRSAISSAHFDADSHRVIAASWDGTARIWEVASLYRRWDSPPIAEDCGVATSLEPDRRFVAVGCEDRPTQIWDTTRGQLVAKLPPVTPAGDDFASAYPAVSAIGDRAAIARGSTVEVYEIPSGQLLYTVTHSAAVNAVAFGATGRDLVSGAIDGSLRVTHSSGAQLAIPMTPVGIDSVGVLPDGRIVITDVKRQLRIFDAGGTELASLRVSARARSIRMSVDYKYIVTLPWVIGKVAPPELWDVEHYRVVASLDDEGQGRVYGARFTADGRIITACGDGAARLWNTSGKLRQTYLGGARFLADATLVPDGSMVVGGGGDGLLRFWDAASGQPLWTMPAHRSHLIGLRIDGENMITRGFSGDIVRWALPKAERIIDACSKHERCGTVLK